MFIFLESPLNTDLKVGVGLLDVLGNLLTTPEVDVAVWTAELTQFQVLLDNVIFDFIVAGILETTEFTAEDAWSV